jgi:DNA replication protein DnaC
MIKTTGGFQYSVNIRYDVDNPTKIASYIPTDTFVALTDEIMASLEPDATNRSRIVIGPYGTGKSHLIAVLAAILKKSLDTNL